MNAAAKETAEVVADAVRTQPAAASSKVLNAYFMGNIAALLLLAGMMFNFSNRLTRVETQIEGYRADVAELRSMIRIHKDKGD